MALPFITPQDYLAGMRYTAFNPNGAGVYGYAGQPSTYPPQPEGSNTPPITTPPAALAALARMAANPWTGEGGRSSPLGPPGQTELGTGSIRGHIGAALANQLPGWDLSQNPPGSIKGLGDIIGLAPGAPGLQSLINAVRAGLKSGVAPSPGHVGASLVGTLMGLMPGFSGPVGALGMLLNTLQAKGYVGPNTRGVDGLLDPHSMPGQAPAGNSDAASASMSSDPASAVAGSDPASDSPGGPSAAGMSGAGVGGMSGGMSGANAGGMGSAGPGSASADTSQSGPGLAGMGGLGGMSSGMSDPGASGVAGASSPADVSGVTGQIDAGMLASGVTAADIAAIDAAAQAAASANASDTANYGGSSNFGGSDSGAGGGSGSGAGGSSDSGGSGAGGGASGGDMSGEGMGGAHGGHVQLYGDGGSVISDDALEALLAQLLGPQRLARGGLAHLRQVAALQRGLAALQH